MKVRKAVIPAAGLGTRFLPATKAMPKEMLPVVDKPALQYIVEEIVASGIEEILIITGRGKNAIEDHFDKSYELEEELKKAGKLDLLQLAEKVSNLVNIHYVRQGEARGLGHATLCAKAFVGNEPFALLLGDEIVDSEVPCLKQIIDCYDKHQRSIIGVQRVDPKDTYRYGIVDIGEEDGRTYKIKSLIEKPKVEEAPSNIAAVGRYVLSPKIFEYLEKTKPGKGGEIQLTDALFSLLQEEEMYAYEYEGKRYDIGSKMGFLKATIEFALKRPDLNKEFILYLFELARQNGMGLEKRERKERKGI